MLIGPPGVGKTHIVVSVLRRVIKRCGAWGLYYDTRALLRDIRSTYNPALNFAEMDLLRPVMEAELLVLDDATFRARFRGTPIKRTGRDRFLRNVLIAAGNSGDKALVPLIEARLEDDSPLVRAMAVWALARLAPHRFRVLRATRFSHEPDQAVRSEWMGEAA